MTSNNTIEGTEYKELPEVGDVPLVSDTSSDMFSRPIDVAPPRADLRRRAEEHGPGRRHDRHHPRRPARSARSKSLPTMLNYAVHAENGSLYNTPPAFAVYALGLVMKWLIAQGGLTAIAAGQRAQGGEALRGDRSHRLLPRHGAQGLPVADERHVPAGDRGAREAVRQGVDRGRPRRPQGPPRRSAACARRSTTRSRRRRRRAGRVHAGVRAEARADAASAIRTVDSTTRSVLHRVFSVDSPQIQVLDRRRIVPCFLRLLLCARRRRHPDSGRGVQHDHLPAPHRDAQGARSLHPAVAWMFKLRAVADDRASRPRSGWRSTASTTRSPTRKAIRTARCSRASGRSSSATSSTTSAKPRTPTSSSATRATSRTDWWDGMLFNHGLLGLVVGTALLCVGARASAGVCWRPAFTPSCTCSCCPRRSTACAITSATRTSTTPRPTSGSLALITGGEGLHNNHHGYPRSPKFSFRASEIDPAWPIIKLLIALRLAKPYKTIDEVARVSAARSSELETGSWSRVRRLPALRGVRDAVAAGGGGGVRGAGGVAAAAARRLRRLAGAASARLASARIAFQCSTISGAPPWISSQVSASRKMLRCASARCARGLAVEVAQPPLQAERSAAAARRRGARAAARRAGARRMRGGVRSRRRDLIAVADRVRPGRR